MLLEEVVYCWYGLRVGLIISNGIIGDYFLKRFNFLLVVIKSNECFWCVYDIYIFSFCLVKMYFISLRRMIIDCFWD